MATTNNSTLNYALPRLLADEALGETKDFCQRLVRVPSPSGDERRIALLVEKEMKRLMYDDVWIDQAGNVIGLVKGEGRASLLFNSHLDHVVVGTEDAWSIPPYEGRILGGHIWGRGSVDMKGALASQVYAVGIMKQRGIKIPGDVYVSCVVMEEVGGLGTRHLMEHVSADYAVVGESTKCNIAVGHRGRLEIVVDIKGVSSHAGMPERGANPHYPMAKLVLGLRDLEMGTSPKFGRSTVSPTVFYVDQELTNVTPGRATLFLDWRNIPSETVDEILKKLGILVQDSIEFNTQGEVRLHEKLLHSYTGYSRNIVSNFPGFEIDADDHYVQAAYDILSSTFDNDLALISWEFTTDAAHLSNAGIKTIGFGPGDPAHYHIVDERLAISELQRALQGNIALALNLGFHSNV